MSNTMQIRYLCWKEARQLLPLLLIILISSLVLFVVGQLAILLYRNDVAIGLRNASIFLSIIAPAIYSVGASPYLIGQEKEQQTLGWLRTLPIASLRIIRCKLLIVLLGFVLTWLFAGLILTFSGVLFVPYSNNYSFELFGTVLLWLLQTLFLLVASTALAWKFESTPRVLLLLLLTATIPLALTELHNFVFRIDTISSPSRSYVGFLTTTCYQVLSIGVAFWLTRMAGLQYFQPEQITIPKRKNDAASELRDIAWVSRSPQSQFSSLLWQTIKQNQSLGIITGLILLVTTLTCASILFPHFVVVDDYARYSFDANLTLVLLCLMILAAFCIAILGANVFISDRVNNRVAFLADRGISPWRVYLSRHAMPLAIFCIVYLVITGILIFRYANYRSDALWIARGMLVLLMIGILCYTVSQWVGQFVSSLLVATVLAIIAISLLPMYIFITHYLGCPVWLMLMLVPLPMVATALTTKRWLDGRFDWVYKTSHLSVLALLAIVPCAPLMIAWSTMKHIPADLERAFEAKFQTADSRNNLEFHFDVNRDSRSVNNNGRQFSSNELIANFSQDEAIDYMLSNIEGQLDDAENRTTPCNFYFVSYQFKDLLSQASLIRLNMAADEPARKVDTASPDRYRRILAMIKRMAKIFRNDPLLSSQDSADQLELFLLYELSQPTASQMLSRDRFEAIASQIADPKARQQTRIRAVVAAWAEWRQYKPQQTGEAARINKSDRHTLGRYVLAENFWRNEFTLTKQLATREIGELLLIELWELAVGGKSAATPERLTKLADLWDMPELVFGQGEQGYMFRFDDIENYTRSTNENFSNFHTNQWFADWEVQAAQLKFPEVSDE